MYPGQNFQTVDVASDIEVNGWANRLLQRHGPPDYVINNAAVINVKCPLWKVGAQEFSEEIDTNIKGVVNTIRHFTPPMIDRGSGVFVNVNSRWGKRFEMQMAPYCATKWALVVLTRVLAEELKPHGIAAVGLNPGVVKTGMLRRYLGTDEIPNESEYLDPQEWATHAVPFILQLGMKDSGKMRNVIRRLTSEVRRV